MPDDKNNWRSVNGRKTGEILKQKYGLGYFKTIARLGAKTTLDRYGKSHFVELGRKGGKVTQERYKGTDHFRTIGKKGGDRLRELVEKGKSVK